MKGTWVTQAPCERGHRAALLIPILVAAAAARLAWRIHKGGDDFWVNGYSFFYELAKNIASGRGLDAMRTPVYPIFLALSSLAGESYLWVVVPQALIGAGTAYCAYLLARDLFGAAGGVLAALMTAFYPYYLVHDTALQETSVFTFLAVLSVTLLMKAGRQDKTLPFVAAGASLGLAVLARQTLAPFAAAVVVWTAVWGVGPRTASIQRAAAMAISLAVVVGVWVARNYIVLGAPVLTSEFGRQVWNAHNAQTFSHYPNESIDRSTGAAFAALSATDRIELEALSGQELAASDWFLAKGLAYIRAHPVETMKRPVRKVAAGFSWRFNPAREPLVQIVYLLSYGPISILAVIGMVLTRHRWRELGPIYLQFLCFAAVTAVFWAHTSHRVYLDVYLIVFAAYTLQVGWSKWGWAASPTRT